MAAMQTFAERVRELATERELPVAQLIHRAGSFEVGKAAPETVKSHIYGRRQPSLRTMQQVAAVLGVDPAEQFLEWDAQVALETSRRTRAEAGMR